MVLMSISCAEPEDYAAGSNKPYGDWTVVDYYVNGQVENSTLLNRFTLERDGNFILEDANGVLSVGTWGSTDTSLTLTSGAGDSTSEVREYQIITATSQKMHLVQDIEVLDLEIRYLLNYSSSDQY